jgi:hypothetical protein
MRDLVILFVHIITTLAQLLVQVASVLSSLNPFSAPPDPQSIASPVT